VKRSLIYTLIFTACFYGGYAVYTWHKHQVEDAYITGLQQGFEVGEFRGVFTCPCWDREGSFCSLCGVKLSKANVFQIINDD